MTDLPPPPAGVPADASATDVSAVADARPGLPEAVLATLTRVEPAPAPQPADPADGALGRLAAWWAAVSPDSGTHPHTHPHPHSVDLEVWMDSGALNPSKPQDRRGGEIADALLAGIAAADRAVDTGATLLVARVSTPVASPRSVTARAVIAVLARREASAVLPQPPGMTDQAWMQVCADIRDRAAAAVAHRGDAAALLAAIGATEVAFWTGALLGAAARRTPCVLDGVEPLAAAVVADRLAYQARSWWLAASDSPDPGRTAAIDRVGLSTGLPLALADDRGRGADAVLALLG